MHQCIVTMHRFKLLSDSQPSCFESVQNQSCTMHRFKLLSDSRPSCFESVQNQSCTMHRFKLLSDSQPSHFESVQINVVSVQDSLGFLTFAPCTGSCFYGLLAPVQLQHALVRQI
ncbi:hypothetical protein A2U01_0001188 [Trifolium medium]|uniref:Uncharacterized protein n=1 Tax=Trifolium medium TaxID=97028 RepID=A0A392LZI0_9FABA|nr:hypothetical protein [Trifolium medium]